MEASMGKIEPGKTYWVTLDKVRFKVKAIRPSAANGWWYCETEKEGNTVVIPESAMVPAE
jgi:hypothetical protein